LNGGQSLGGADKDDLGRPCHQLHCGL
jgi:hypothetical protein